jgi:hypothetical protein
LSPNGVAVIDVIVSSEDTNVVLISEIVGTPPFEIKRSDDGGANFSFVYSVIANRILFDTNDNDTVYVAANDGLHISTDFGLTFSPWTLAGVDCRSLAVNGSDVYTGTTDGKLFKVSYGVATEITGSWSVPVEIKSILLEGDNLFVGMNGAEKDTSMVLQGSIWQSTNEGGTWNEITTDMTSTNIYGNNIIVSDGSELYVGTYGGGIFKSFGLDLSAGLNEFKDSGSVSIYPNPSQDIIAIHSENINSEDFTMHTIHGTDVSNKVKRVSNSNGELVLDISSLERGTYLIQLPFAESTSIKFVKN